MTRRSFGLLGLAFLVPYLIRNGIEVWPFLFRSAGDFGNFHAAGRALLQGGSPYADWLDYPPLLPVMMVPFGAFELQTARIVWFLIGHACLLGSALLLWKPLGGDLPAAVALGTIWAFTGAAQENLALGQVSPLLLLLIAWAVRADTDRPRRSAAALGLAAAIKIWPGVLLAADLLPGRRRAFAVGAGIAAAGVAGPFLLLAALFPPPWAPRNAGYWMGTPAPLNVSLPAVALRLTYDRSGDRVPEDWEAGVHASLRLPVWRRAVSAGTACATLAVGLLAAGVSLRGHGRIDPHARFPLLAALLSLALLASPISWYHYQMTQLPGLAWLTAEAIRRRAWGRLAGVAALAAGLTRREVRDLLLAGGGAARAMLPGLVAVALGGLLFVLLLLEVRRAVSRPYPS